MTRILALVALVAGVFTPARAASPDDYAAGTGTLESLVTHQHFRLTHPYRGRLQRTIGTSDLPDSRDVNFAYFIYDASLRGEPDQPYPKQPAIFEGSPANEHFYSTGLYALLEQFIPSDKQILACRTRSELAELIPALTERDSEYCGFVLRDDRSIEVICLILDYQSSQEPTSQIRSIDLWRGIISPDGA